MNIKFSCTFYSGRHVNKEYENLISKMNPEKEDVLKYLEYLEGNRGAASLSIIPEPEEGIIDLSVRCDGEKYLLTLIEYGKEGEYFIRTSNMYQSSDKLIDFEGEPYPPSEVIMYFGIVKKAFLELLETGYVSYDLMSPPMAPLPNGNMADAHAEIAVIQQAYNEGTTKGQDMSIHLTGGDVCGHCRQDIALAARNAGLKSVTVYTIDKHGNPVIYDWKPTMKAIKLRNEY